MSEHIAPKDVPTVIIAACTSAAVSFTKNEKSNATWAYSENPKIIASENEASMIIVIDDTSFQNFDDVSNHTDVDNDVICSMN